MSPDEIELLRTWVPRHRFSFSMSETGVGDAAEVTLVEVATGKSLQFRWAELAAVEQARDENRGGSYLRIRLSDGRNFAIAGIGFVFEPCFVNSGPVPDCPPVASFADFEKLLAHLDHTITDEKDNFDKEALQLIMVLIAFVDGARLIGLDVGAEEKRLETQLKRMEQRGLPPA